MHVCTKNACKGVRRGGKLIPILLGAAAITAGGYFGGQALVEQVSEEAGEAIGTAASGLIAGLGPMIGALGPAIVTGFTAAVEGARNAIDGNEKEFFEALTIIVCAFGGYWALKGSLMPKSV